jgi:aryl-alcohol dehydrogenase-like predicted oxidoreductase
MSANRIALGTVQFGLDYGINNPGGEIKKEEVFSILNYAGKNGIDTLDTAFAYGNAESKIGEFLDQNKNYNFKIVSKLAPKAEISEKSLDLSLQKLHQKKLYGYLAHDFGMFNRNVDLLTKFTSLKSSGSIEKIGFSLYHIADLEFLLEHKIGFDLIQIPFSIFDQRFARYFKILKEKNIEIHTRSSFLQGLVFMDPGQLPEKLKAMKGKLENLISISKTSAISIHSLCIGFCSANREIDKIVLGVTSLQDLKQNIEGSNVHFTKTLFNELLSLNETNENLILPVNWQ